MSNFGSLLRMGGGGGVEGAGGQGRRVGGGSLIYPMITF